MSPSVFLILAISAIYVSAFPSGAPANICGRYVPSGHRNLGTPVANGPQTGPYTLTVNSVGNGLFNVVLKSTTAQPFMGYVIQAVPSWKQLPDGPSDIIGAFQPDFASGQSQVRTCGAMGGSNVLTHTSKMAKNQAQATWQAPRNLPDPTIKFVATVVRNQDNFYVIHSNPVNLRDTGSAGTSGSQGGMGATFPLGTASGTATNTNTGLMNTMSTNTGMTSTSTSGGQTSFGTNNNQMPTNTGANAMFNSEIVSFNTNTNTLDSGISNDPPPFILPNGELAIHSKTDAINSVAIPSGTQNTFSSSSSQFVSTSEVISPQSDSILPDVPPPSIVSPPFEANTAPTSSISFDSILTASSPTDSETVLTIGSASSGTSSSSAATTDAFSTGSNVQSFDGMTDSLSLDGGLNIAFPPVDQNDPLIQVIEIPILPEGQTAALLNISSGKVSITVDNAIGNDVNGQRQGDEPLNILSVDVGAQGQVTFGQSVLNPSTGQTFSTGMSNQFGQGGSTFGNQFGSQFGRPGSFGGQGSSQFGGFGGAGMGGGQMGPFGQRGPGMFGQRTTFGQGTMGPFGAGGMTFGQGGGFGGQGQTRPFGGQGQTGPFGGQGQTGPFGGQGQTGPFGGQGQTGPFGGQGQTGPFGGQGQTRPFGGQGQTGPFGGQGQTGPFGGQGQTGQFGGQGQSGPFGGQMFGGQTTQFGGQSPFGGPTGPFGGMGSPFGQGGFGQGGQGFGGAGQIGGNSMFGGATTQFGGGSPFGAGGMGGFPGQGMGMGGATGMTGFGMQGGQFGGQTFGGQTSGMTGGGQSFGGSIAPTGETGGFGPSFGPGVSSPGQTGTQGGMTGQGMFNTQGSFGSGGLQQGTAGSTTGFGGSQTFGGATGQDSGLNSFSFGG